MSHGKSKWGNYVGAPRVIDKSFTNGSYTVFGSIPRRSIAEGGMPGVHKLHYIHEYAEADANNGNYSSIVAGQVVYTAQNSTLNTDFSWVVPAGVSSVSAVCVGGGGGGGGNNGSSGPGASAGGGGELSYGTISTTPGETLTLKVGQGGIGGTTSANPSAGTVTQIRRGSTILLGADFGNQGATNISSGGAGSGGAGTAAERGSGYVGGGNGGTGGAARNNGNGAGGGGAGGYSGNGGNENAAGAGGGGGGGRADNGSASRNATQSGGGVGLYGEGSSGTGGGGLGSQLGPVSGIGSQTSATPASNGTYGQASTFGGGGGAIEDDTASYGFTGGSGGIRIIWGNGRSYPSTNTADV